MYLKSIEVQGFKSFAKKILFDFHEGITGIVGPNGSGKSNVADAVRWVLGEQRVKQLRGGSMQDVIFSGTELRKPLSYAYVAITLDNSDRKLAIDYSEVTIARRLYRSGESEYSINGTVCRLKDVNELFYDTGIGKEGYSIIGQGQIDKILSGKPEERRELFDEAAGIVKFKRRKNMSVKKLEDERQNLIRVSDILSEIEKQVGPLEKQAETAKIYLSKKEILKKYDINMFLLEAERIKLELKSLDEKIDIVDMEINSTNASFDYMKAEYENAEDEIDFVDSEIESYRKKSSETTILKQQLENQIEVLKEQINSVRKSDEHILNRLSIINDEITSRNEKKELLLKDQETIKSELDIENDKKTEGEKSLSELQDKILGLNAKSESCKNKVIELINSKSSTKVDMQRFETMLEQNTLRVQQLNQQLNSSVEEQSASELRKKALTEKMNESEQVYLEVSELVKEYEAKIVKLKNDVELNNRNLQEKQTTYHRENSRLESLKNITERYDGYGNSIKRVMEQKGTNSGLLGVVADLIKTEKKYETAIETALGGSIQNIVTDNEQTAKRMIQYLKQNRFGRATFLPLSSMNTNQGIRRTEVLQESGVIGVASTLVIVDDQYKKLADNLLGRTIVVDHIDTGIFLSKKYQQSLRIVTVDGELLNPGGSITGGAFKNTSNLLGRRREIEELESKVQQLQSSLKALMLVVNSQKQERTNLYQKLDEKKVLLQDRTVEKNTLSLKLSQENLHLEELTASYHEFQLELDDINTQNEAIGAKSKGIQVELESSEEKEREYSTHIEEIQNEIIVLKAQEASFIEKNEMIRLAVANKHQTYAFATENVKRISDEIEKLELESRELDTNKDEASQEILDKQSQITEVEETIIDAKEVFVEIEEEIKKLVETKESLNKKHKTLITKREETTKHLGELDKEKYRLTTRREGLDEASEKNISYMWDEYELTYSRAMELRDANLTDLNVMKKEIQKLKSEIKALGSVNVNAIDDYKELLERYTFLKTQHDDLIEAEQTLVQIIEELDAAMREQFKNQFELISKEYDSVFKQLFGGGKGTLELMEAEDILDAGVKIIAQPPGKKLQNMMQLSGGEKALTAIALLFAIQNLKPSPFCLLDEIEAALDDSNVTRFAQYLHKLTASTQFIVITHRRGTMTAADRLYGITMQEKGVSTLVSVDLLDDKLTN